MVIVEIIIMNFVEVRKKENLNIKSMVNNLLAANNIKRFAFVKNNTEGTSEFQACGDEGLPLSEKQEAQPIAFGVGG
jgi:hypothetical protein